MTVVWTLIQPEKVNKTTDLVYVLSRVCKLSSQVLPLLRFNHNLFMNPMMVVSSWNKPNPFQEPISQLWLSLGKPEVWNDCVDYIGTLEVLPTAFLALLELSWNPNMFPEWTSIRICFALAVRYRFNCLLSKRSWEWTSEKPRCA